MYPWPSGLESAVPTSVPPPRPSKQVNAQAAGKTSAIVWVLLWLSTSCRVQLSPQNIVIAWIGVFRLSPPQMVNFWWTVETEKHFFLQDSYKYIFPKQYSYLSFGNLYQAYFTILFFRLNCYWNLSWWLFSENLRLDCKYWTQDFNIEANPKTALRHSFWNKNTILIF